MDNFLVYATVIFVVIIMYVVVSIDLKLRALLKSLSKYIEVDGFEKHPKHKVKLVVDDKVVNEEAPAAKE